MWHIGDRIFNLLGVFILKTIQKLSAGCRLKTIFYHVTGKFFFSNQLYMIS